MSHLRRELGMFVALVLMCLGLWISNPDFLGQSNVVNTTRQIAMLGIFGIGSAFVIITGGIDLSVGSLIGLTGVLIAKFSSTSPDCCGWSYGIGIPLAMAIVLHRHPRRNAVAARSFANHCQRRHAQLRR
jgi:ribose transport system permease protein